MILLFPTFWPVSNIINVDAMSKGMIELINIFLITLWMRWRQEMRVSVGSGCRSEGHLAVALPIGCSMQFYLRK